MSVPRPKVVPFAPVPKAGEPSSTDGLEALLSDFDVEGTPLDGRMTNWRSMCPDDVKSHPVQARIPDRLVRSMDALLVRARGYAWESRSDFIREAIWNYARAVTGALGIQDETLLSLLAEQEIAGRAAFANRRQTALDSAVIDCRNYLTELVNADDLNEAQRFISELAVTVRKIRIRSWREQWETTLRDLPIMQIVVYLVKSRGDEPPKEFVFP